MYYIFWTLLVRVCALALYSTDGCNYSQEQCLEHFKLDNRSKKFKDDCFLDDSGAFDQVKVAACVDVCDRESLKCQDYCSSKYSGSNILVINLAAS